METLIEDRGRWNGSSRVLGYNQMTRIIVVFLSFIIGVIK